MSLSVVHCGRGAVITLRMTTMVVWLTVFISSCMGQFLFPFTAPCTQSVDQFFASGQMYFATSGVLRDLGKYDACQTQPFSRFCTSYFRFMCIRDDGSSEVLVSAFSCADGPVLGHCMPNRSTCPTSTINNQLLSLTQLNPLFQAAFGNNTYCTSNNRLTVSCNKSSYTFLEADCMDELPSFTGDKYAVTAFSMVVALVSIAVLCGLGRWVYSLCRDEDEKEATGGAHRPLLAPKEGSNAHASTTINAALVVSPPPFDEPPTTFAAIQRFLSSVSVTSWFDLFSNVKDFFSVRSRNVGDIDTRFFEGIRTLAMLGVVYGHSMYFPALYGMYNGEYIVDYFKKYESIMMFPAEVAVDTFFFLTGFLFFHLYLRYAEKHSGGRGQPVVHPKPSYVAMLCLRRYFRMTPVVMLTMACAVWLFPFLPTGLMHGAYRDSWVFHSCHRDWWRQMLYITNLNDGAEWGNCMSWFWYLSADFQMYVAGPILVAPYFYSKKIFHGLMIVGILVVSALQILNVNGAYLGHDATRSMYDKPWIRCNPFLYGLLCASLVRLQEVRTFFAARGHRWCAYALGGSLLLVMINIMWLAMKCNEEENSSTPPTSSCPEYFDNFMNVYVVFGYGLALSCFSVPWAVGGGGPIKEFLCLPVFAVAAKLTYCCYMLHPVVLMIAGANSFFPPQFTGFVLYERYASTVVFAFLSAFLLHIFAEVPFAKINDAFTRME